MVCLISAPSSLGLRPPRTGAIPGCYKAPEALRRAGLFESFERRGGSDCGTVEPGSYLQEVLPGSVRNQTRIVEFSRLLSSKILDTLRGGDAPLVVGGDCSILIGSGIALKKAGRYGLVHLDGHTDFRNPGNSDLVASLAGEDLAAAVGLHWDGVSDIDGLRPYFEPEATVHAGCRDGDEHISEVAEKIGAVLPASEMRRRGMKSAASTIRATVERTGLDGFWLHLDVDILDPTVMPAVDSPSPGGLDCGQLVELVERLSPGAVGAEVTIFDPELDPTGRYARVVAGLVDEGMMHLGEESQARV
ncbi:MAG: arginase family protein [Nitrososphaerota archaeon]|nr:arginase family protein [Nitrososphaerota archaeon]MCL5671948.1 arginase family protein [Nitrososphaerota archaeon]MDG6912220.1 arginase family protein [Nitrososphaerota archaeon]MDG6936990.1 arginase family protein [Nitrososphaerota archaeon]MDG6945395.1 arginase family protein [Nitrososphaerota archaeon]